MTLNITMLCHYAECRILFIVMLNVFMLSVIMLSIVMLRIIMVSVVAPTRLHFLLLVEDKSFLYQVVI